MEVHRIDSAQLPSNFTCTVYSYPENTIVYTGNYNEFLETQWNYEALVIVGCDSGKVGVILLIDNTDLYPTYPINDDAIDPENVELLCSTSKVHDLPSYNSVKEFLDDHTNIEFLAIKTTHGVSGYDGNRLLMHNSLDMYNSPWLEKYNRLIGEIICLQKFGNSSENTSDKVHVCIVRNNNVIRDPGNITYIQMFPIGDLSFLIWTSDELNYCIAFYSDESVCDSDINRVCAVNEELEA